MQQQQYRSFWPPPLKYTTTCRTEGERNSRNLRPPLKNAGPGLPDANIHILANFLLFPGNGGWVVGQTWRVEKIKLNMDLSTLVRTDLPRHQHRSVSHPTLEECMRGWREEGWKINCKQRPQGDRAEKKTDARHKLL
jgi:hypothetical protein